MGAQLFGVAATSASNAWAVGFYETRGLADRTQILHRNGSTWRRAITPNPGVHNRQGALIWMRDLAAWTAEAARLLRPAGHLFIFEAHPMVPLWTWDKDEPHISPENSR
jgi:hypothetical protein